MPITKATASSVAPAAKGDLVVGSATNDAAVLGVGSNDQVLTADSSTDTGLKWATASSGGMTLISTQTPSSVASFTFSSIPGTYKNLYLLCKQVRMQFGGGWIGMRYNSDSNNRYISFYTNNAPIATNFGENHIRLGTNIDQGASTAFAITNIYDYTNTTTWKVSNTFSWMLDDAVPTSAFIINQTGAYNVTNAITDITVICDSGNTIVSGTFELYGVK